MVADRLIGAGCETVSMGFVDRVAAAAGLDREAGVLAGMEHVVATLKVTVPLAVGDSDTVGTA